MGPPEKLGFQDPDKFVRSEIGLSEHPVKQGSGNIAPMLVAYSYLQDSSIRQNFLPCLVLFRSNHQESSFMQDLSEIGVSQEVLIR